MARTSPNSRASFVQVEPPSVERKSWPRLLAQNSRFGSALLVATHQGVLLSVPGSPASRHVSARSVLRNRRPLSPGGPLPLVRYLVPSPSAAVTTEPVHCAGASSGRKEEPIGRERGGGRECASG